MSTGAAIKCQVGLEAKLVSGSWKCITCEGYGMQGGKCYECPANADCTTSPDGFDVAANPGYWRGPPFFETCISNNTRSELKSKGAWNSLNVSSNKEINTEGNKKICEGLLHGTWHGRLHDMR